MQCCMPTVTPSGLALALFVLRYGPHLPMIAPNGSLMSGHGFARYSAKRSPTQAERDRGSDRAEVLLLPNALTVLASTVQKCCQRYCH